MMAKTRMCVAAGLVVGLIGAGTAPLWAAAERQLGYVTGVRSPEDLVGIPHSPWIITSGLAEGKRAGSLFLIDRRTKTALDLLRITVPMRQDRSSYPSCPGPLNKAVISAHGIGLRKGQSGKHILYVLNHGGREAIEVFQVDAARQRPSLTWVGCIPLPENTVGNGVAPMPGGGIVMTHMAVPRYFATPQAAKSPEAWTEKFTAGALTGYAATWTAASGWKEVPGTEGSGPNGIEVSPDGRWIWVANWPVREVVRVPARPVRGGPRRTVLKLDFLPDNLRWGDDGWLWVAGAAATPPEFFACVSKPGCRGDYRIARINPATLAVQIVPHPRPSPTFGDATTAAKLGDTIWLGAVAGERVAYLPAAARTRAKVTAR
jgi:hypothetical protein